MQKQFKFLFALAICLATMIWAVPLTASAADISAQGTCGDNLTWTLDSAGIFTVSGEGPMYTYDFDWELFYEPEVPWNGYRSSIKKVVIEDGVTSISQYAFYECVNLTEVTIGNDVETIGFMAFSHTNNVNTITMGSGIKKIADMAFNGWVHLEKVYISDLAAWCAIEFEDYMSHPMHRSGFYDEIAVLYINGVEATDIVIPDGVTSIGKYAFYIDDLGFSIPQGHLIFMNAGNITSMDNTYAIDNLKRNLDVFYTLGVKATVLHYSNFGSDIVPVEKWFDVRVEALNKLTAYIRGTDMSICLENLSRIHDFDAGHLLKMCKAVDYQEHIGICLDTGHLNISQRGNQYDFIMQAGKYLKAMHVHDNRGEQYGLTGLPCDWHIMPFAGGNIKWDDVKRGVKELNYKHLFSFEIGDTGIPLEIKKIQMKYLLDCYNAYFSF